MEKFDKDKNHQRVRDYCPYIGKCRGVAHSFCNFKFNDPNESPVVFHYGSNYNDHLIIKELVKII